MFTMRSQILALMLVLFLFVVFSSSVSHAVELARVGSDVITSDQFIEDWRYVAPLRETPDTTFQGKKDFLDAMIAKRLLSHYFRSRSWDTLAVWGQVLAEYEKSIYIQALYRDALPEAREPWKSNAVTLAGLGMKFVDSLYAAYNVKVEEKTVIFIADKSVGLLKTAPTDKQGRPIVRWSQLFTDEEKKLPVAVFTGGQFTIGQFATEVDNTPSFARPTAGNSDEIVDTIELMAREGVFKVEFEKRNLRQQPWFVERITNKREELIADQMFSQMTDTSTVTKDEVTTFFDEHRDDFITQMLIKVALITVGSESVAEEAVKRIADGESFESVAVDLSVYTSSPTGFDTTDFIDGSQMPVVYSAIADKKIGEVTGPVHDSEQYAWHVVKLLGRESPRLLSLEEATPMMVERFKMLKADKGVARLIEELRSKENVTANYELLDTLELPKLK